MVNDKIATLAERTEAAKYRIEGAAVAVRWFADESAAAAALDFVLSNDRKKGGGGGIDGAALTSAL